MKTQKNGTGDGLSTYRKSLLSAMSGVLVAPFFRAGQSPIRCVGRRG
jgi:hypothetical protein